MEYPEIGEIVVVKVKKILSYGVFVELLEYDGLTGFVHISEVASSWVKNIRNFVKENQIRAAKVLKGIPEKEQVDLSFEKVPKHAQRTKIESWRQFKRCQKLLELLAKKHKKPFDEVWHNIAEPLMQHYDSLYAAFQQIALHKEKAAKGVPKKWIKPLLQLVEKNIEIPKRKIQGIITVGCDAPNGAEVIRKILTESIKKFKEKEITIDAIYQGSNKFLFTVISPDYKTAEKKFNALAEHIAQEMKKNNGFAEYKLLEKD